jgi:hypothetical protein
MSNVKEQARANFRHPHQPEEKDEEPAGWLKSERRSEE